MNPFAPKDVTGPEAKIEKDVMKALRGFEWFVKKIHGNAYQSGLPDLFAAHMSYGQRWIEIKYIENYSFTKAQQEDFPKLQAAGVGIWILTSDHVDELAKLFKPPNWQDYYLRWVHGVR